MKKISFFTIFLSLSVLLTDCWAQTSVVAHANMPFPIERTIIREHNFPSTVSFVELEKRGYFVYADTTYTATYLPIDSNFFVNDFVIDDDTVWLCGKTIQGQGFVGFFEINEFFFGSNNYYLIKDSLLSTHSVVQDLTKLVSYVDDSTIRHIVAIGTTKLGQYCVVNLTNSLSDPVWLYETGEVPATSPETMIAVQTSDYNVFTGGMYLIDPNNPGLAMRAYDRHYVFTDPNDIHNYTNEIIDIASQYSFCMDQMSLLQMSCNEIAVAAYYKKYQDGLLTLLPEGTYIGRYHIGIPKQIMSHLHSILVPHNFYNGGWKLYGFSKKYLNDNTFNLLQEYEDPGMGNLKSFVYELSSNIVNSALPFSGVTTSSYYFKSICGYFVYPNYLMIGFPKNDNSNLVYNMGVQGKNNCLEMIDLNPTPISMTDIAHYEPLSIVSGKCVFDNYNSIYKTTKIVIKCATKSNR